MKITTLPCAIALSIVLAGCATQQAMTVATSDIGAPVAKYRQAMAVGSVTGGAMMNVLTMPGVSSDAFKAALDSSLSANGYAAAGAPKYTIDAEILDLKQPLIGLDMDVTSSVTYKVSGGGTTTPYTVQATATASVSDSIIGADRVRIANERAMRENIRKFLQGLK